MQPDISLEFDTSRDAWGAIAGYVYQVLRTIDRWLSVDEDTLLLCEYGEDIYEETPAVDGFLGGNIRLEQVKHHAERNITLRSPEVVKALANFAYTLSQETTSRLRFSFFTNSLVVAESGLQFPLGLPGIRAWEAIRLGELNRRQRREALTSIQTVLTGLSRPVGTSAQDQVFDALLSITSDRKSLEDFIDRVEWHIGAPDPRELHSGIISELIKSRLATTSAEGRQIFCALFFHVFDRLSQRGIKQLNKSDLRRVAQKSTLVEIDRERLNRLVSVTDRLGETVPAISMGLEEARSRREEIGEQLKTRLDKLLSISTGGTPLQPPRADVPALPPAVCAPRGDLVEQIRMRLTETEATALVGEMGCGKSTVARLLLEGYQGPMNRPGKSGGSKL